MKNLQLLAFAILMSTLFISCEKNIFGPNQGAVSGVVTNTLSVPLSGVVITANYTQEPTSADETAIEKKVQTVTDNNGFYEIQDILLTEVRIEATKAGLENSISSVFLSQDNNNQVANFELVGFPEITSFSVSSEILTTSDTAFIDLNVSDSYSENTTNTITAHFLLYEQDNTLNQSIELEEVASSSITTRLSGLLIANNLPPQTYTYQFEILDSDGNVTTSSFNSLIIQ